MKGSRVKNILKTFIVIMIIICIIPLLLVNIISNSHSGNGIIMGVS